MKNQLIKFAAIGAMAAGMAFAQAPGTNPNPVPGKAAVMRPRARMRQRLLQALNLTDAQKQQAKAFFQEARQSAQGVTQQLKQNREALQAAIKANDTASIQRLSVTQGNLQGQVLTIRSEAMAKVYGILTPDQKAKMDQIQQRVHQRMQGMRKPVVG